MARAWCRHKSPQIQRAAGLRPGARQALAAERLHADHRADHVAVDVDVAGPDARGDVRDGLVDAGVQAEGQAVAGGVDLRRSARRGLRGRSAPHAAPGRRLRARVRRCAPISISVGGDEGARAAVASGSGSACTLRPRVAHRLRCGRRCAACASRVITGPTSVASRSGSPTRSSAHRALAASRACGRRCRPAGTARAAPSSAGRR